YRLVQFTCGLPAEYIIRNGYTKAILRDALNGLLPDKVRTRTTKLGFATPLPLWMASSLKPYFLVEFKKLENPYLDGQNFNQAFEKYPHSNLHAWDFFRTFCFSRWYQMNFAA